MEPVAIVRNAGEPVTSEAGVTHPSLVSLGVLHFVQGRVSRESDAARIGCRANTGCTKCRNICYQWDRCDASAPRVARCPAFRTGIGCRGPEVPGECRPEVPGECGQANPCECRSRERPAPRESRTGEDASVQQSLACGDGASECAPPEGARADVDARAELGRSVR